MPLTVEMKDDRRTDDGIGTGIGIIYIYIKRKWMGWC